MLALKERLVHLEVGVGRLVHRWTGRAHIMHMIDVPRLVDNDGSLGGSCQPISPLVRVSHMQTNRNWTTLAVVASLLLVGCTSTAAPSSATETSGSTGSTPLASDTTSSAPATPASTTATTATATASAPDEVTVGPDEPWIAYQLPHGSNLQVLDIHLVRPDGTGDHVLLDDRPGNQTHPDWSPDGSQLAYTVDETEIWTANTDGTNPVRLPIDCSKPCGLLDEAAWSPDGQELVFIREEYPDGKLPVNRVQAVDLATNTVRTLYMPPTLHGANHPRWAPDGKSIVFELSRFASARANGPDGSVVETLDLTDPAAEPVLITDWPMFAAYPDWSWVTDTIVFTTYDLSRRSVIPDPTQPSDLYTIKPDGSGLTQLTHNPSGTTLVRLGSASGPLSAQPTWSPEGTSIIFTQVDGDEFAGWTLATINADGAQQGPAAGPTPIVGTHPRLRPTSR
jgi:Tol biopolymer transport system component